jgi:hypothetical protein
VKASVHNNFNVGNECISVMNANVFLSVNFTFRGISTLLPRLYQRKISESMDNQTPIFKRSSNFQFR